MAFGMSPFPLQFGSRGGVIPFTITQSDSCITWASVGSTGVNATVSDSCIVFAPTQLGNQLGISGAWYWGPALLIWGDQIMVWS